MTTPATKTTFQFRKGDRVDFLTAGAPNRTHGTITSRVHQLHEPAYRVRWDDSYREPTTEPDANIWLERDLTAVASAPATREHTHS